MNPDATGLDLPADLRARLAGIAFRTRAPAPDGPLGRQLSRSRGAGVEFSQYRGYSPGDPLRQVDWKLYARSDRYYVREAERDSPLTLLLVIDASASMAQADRARHDWSRLHAARRLAACAIEIALREGDAFGVLTLGGESAQWLPPTMGRGQRDEAFRLLAGTRAAGGWPQRKQVEALAGRVGHGALVLLLSDLFDDTALELLERLAGAGRDAAAVRILTVEERDFPFDGAFLLRDPESGVTRECDGARVRENFLARFGDARRAMAARLAAHGVALAEHVLDRPEDAALRALFGGRR